MTHLNLKTPTRRLWSFFLFLLIFSTLQIGCVAYSLSVGSLSTTNTENDTPTITIGGQTVAESTSYLDFTVTLSKASSDAVTVDWHTVDHTATSGQDYTSSSGTITFSPGETGKNTRVILIPDTLDESDEAFSIVLTNPTRSTIENNMATIAITDDDTTPTSISFFSYTFDEIILQKDVAMTDYSPTNDGSDLTFSISPTLPTGLSLNSSNGTISGTPTTEVVDTVYTITAANSVNSKNFDLKLSVLLGLTVDTTNDGNDVNGTDSTCFSSTASGCSLRAAVQTANFDTNIKAIFLDSQTYSLASALTASTDDLAIVGKGSANTIIQPSSTHPGHRFTSFSASGKTLRLAQLMIRNFGTANGAVISQSSGTVLETFNSFVNNRASDGGVFALYGGSLNSKSSHFEQNVGTHWGGVLHIEGSGTTATFERTFATTGSSSWGGFSHAYSGAIVTIKNSTLYNNSSTSNGVTACNSGNYFIRNSTIVGNTNTGSGAPGIYFYNSGCSYTLSNNIIANNTDSSSTVKDCYRNNTSATLTSEGGNILSSNGDNCASLFNGTNDRLSTDPLLISSPALNSGLTLSFLVDAASPAIDTGINSVCTDKDQRGKTRPIDYNNSGSTCDVGSIEMFR